MDERRHQTTVDGVTAWASEWSQDSEDAFCDVFTDDGSHAEQCVPVDRDGVAKLWSTVPPGKRSDMGVGCLALAMLRPIASILLEAAHIAETGELPQ